MTTVINDIVADVSHNVSRWYDSDSPCVSIVILNFNKSDLTQKCLDHIWLYTTDISYEIIVVDNGSRAEDFANLARKCGSYRLVRLEKNRFYGEGNNLGVEQARGKFICFLNNDAFVTSNWLLPLWRVLDQGWNAGAVGPQFLYPDGRLQEVGAFVDEEGRSYQVGKRGILYNQSDIEQVRIVDYCSAACLLVRKELFVDVGGFDLAFEPAYYEDVDLCFKLAELGRFIYCCPESTVIHIENATTATNRNVLGEHTVEQNRMLFVSRWKNLLRKRSRNEGVVTRSATKSKLLTVRQSHRGKVAFYTTYDLTLGGGERYLLSAAAIAGSLADVYLVTEVPYSQLRLTSLSYDMALDLSHITMITRDQLHKIMPIDVCVIMGNEILPMIRGFGRYNYFLCQFPFPINDVNIASWWSFIDDIQSYLCYSIFAYNYIALERSKLGASRPLPIEVISPPVIQISVERNASLSVGKLHVISIGRFFAGGHNKRHDVAIDCIKRLNADGYNLDLHLVGSVSMNHPSHVQRLVDLRQSAEGFPVYFYPNAGAETLKQLLEKCSIYIHAAGFEVDLRTEAYRCEHFGISVLEAMSAGCVPFVVDNGGPAEFVKDGYNGYLYNSLQELSAKISSLVKKPEKILELSQSAKDTADKFDIRHFNEKWTQLLLRHLKTGVTG